MRHNKWVTVVIPVVCLGVALMAAIQLIRTRPTPQRAAADEPGALVETMAVERTDHRMSVHGRGTVVPAQEAIIRPQISGRVIWLHSNIIPGGRIEQGEPLFRIERSDFEIEVEQRETELEEAEAQLALERGRRRVAEREWELFREEGPEGAQGPQGPSELALREPQLRAARAAVRAAEARLRRAKLDLERTVVSAPFDAIVREESIDPGEVVDPQTATMTLVGTSAFRVQAAVPTDRLSYIDLPGVNASQGSAATIRHDVGSTSLVREGRVVRLLGDVDPKGRMARVLIRIDDPLRQGGGSGSREGSEPRLSEGAYRQAALPLLLEAYVDVRIEGNQREELFELPRQALREGDQAYVYEGDGTLSIRELEVAWRLPKSVLVRDGLREGDAVIVTPLRTAVDGMKLRRVGERASGEDAMARHRAAPRGGETAPIDWKR